ncbi:IMP dehydrogenase [Candidatus Roizmanbacteria bacterium]|nr:IMP dehydrogenase [Candidatus Roizmanbacteria bacterium]
MKILEGLTYDDVLLIPQKSYIDHRSDVSTKTRLTRHISLNLPFVSANMDTVTEAEMAIALAREGGIGIIHRFMTVEEQVEQVKKVKRNEGFILGNPYTVTSDTPLIKIINKAKKNGVDGFLVVDEKNRLVGILSKRDYSFETDLAQKTADLMTPIKRLITGKMGIKAEAVKKIFSGNKIEKLPLVDKDGVLKGLITARAIKNYEKFPTSTKDKNGRYLVGAAVGVVKDYLERAEALINAGCDVIVVDVAHGHNNVAMRAIASLRKKFKNVDLIGGNVATAEGARDLIKMGVDAVKVGIGPGGLCTTRMVAGVGVPQFTAVSECSAVAKRYGVPVIADGGTNYPGDMAKALAAGGSTCMLAGWFAGTDESPGGIIMRKGMKFKVHRGSASFLATADRKMELENNTEQQLNTIVPEGVEAMVPYKGKVSDVVYQLTGALKSGMSYCNAKTIPELWKNARFVKVTEAGFRESKSHNVEEL